MTDETAPDLDAAPAAGPPPAPAGSPLDGQPLSGVQEHLGFRIVAWRENHAEIELPVEPFLLNRSGVVHGGILALLVDAVGGHAACYCPVPGRVRTAATLSLTTSYLAPARLGPLRVVGRVRGGGRKIFIASAEIFDAQGTLVALGEGTYKYDRGSETLEGRPVDPARER